MNDTDVTLREHLDAMLNERWRGLLLLLKERDRRLEERFASQQLALNRSEESLSNYKTSSNEWRGALDDSSSKMMSRVEWDTAHRLLIDRFETWSRTFEVRITDMDQRLSKNNVDVDKRVVVIEGRAGYASVTLIVAVCAMLVALLGVLWGHTFTLGAIH